MTLAWKEGDAMPAGIWPPVAGQGQLVPTAGGWKVAYANLDNAASTPALVEAARRVRDFLPWYASVHRGAGLKSRLSTAVFEGTRPAVARFFGYDPASNVVLFGKNTTEALNKLAYRWPWQSGDMIVTSLLEHHSNDLPWRERAQLIYLGMRPDGGVDLDQLAWCLRTYAPRVKLVALTGASNVTGCLSDLHAAAVLAHQYGAKIAVDAAQLAAHRPICARPDADPGHLDFLAASAHKMYAPFGQGVLIGPRSFFLAGRPEYAGGGTVSAVTLGAVRWAEPPEREEAGTPNVLGALAMATALGILERTGLARIAAHERELTTKLYQGLAPIPGVTLYGPPFPPVDRVGIVSFNLTGLPHDLVAAALACEWGIGVRSGCFCARPYVQRLLGVAESEALRLLVRAGEEGTPPGMVRASLGLYNTEAEIGRLVEAVGELAAAPGKWRERYEIDRRDGYWWPKGWRVDYAELFAGLEEEARHGMTSCP